MSERKSMVMVFKIDIEFDVQAQVFIATSKDIHGLALEADTPEEMRRHLSDVVPVLLQRNHGISLAEEADKHTLDLNIKSILPWLEAEGLQGTRAAG